MCLKICDYISKVRSIEVLQMQAQFFKDENGFIWFFYATNIQTRKNLHRTAMNSIDAQRESKKAA
jgi:hypothetical protein